MPSKRLKTVVNVLLVLCILVAVASYFLPFLEKTNYRMDYLEEYPFRVGNDFFMARVSFILIGYSTFISLYKNHVWTPAVVSFANLFTLLLLRYSIHYSGFRGFDHDFETKTAYGYHLLVIASCVQFVFILIKSFILPRAIKTL